MYSLQGSGFTNPFDRETTFVKIPGQPHSPLNPPSGCVFHPRCPKVFDVIEKMKTDIDARELSRLRDRIAPRRCKDAKKNEALLDGLVQRTLYGTAPDEIRVETVTREEMIAAARRYMPSHRQAYVRLALKGQ